MSKSQARSGADEQARKPSEEALKRLSNQELRERPSTWRMMMSNMRIAIPGFILLVIIVIGVIGPWITPHDPLAQNIADRLQGPSSTYFFGTDEYGRDLFSRILHGSQNSLIIAFGAVTLATIGGVLFGLIGGYFGGIWEIVTMRTVDVLLTFPPILLAIVVVAFLGSSIPNLIFVIALLYMTNFARITFGSVVQVKQRDYVEAARVIGATSPRILRTAVLPNILAPIFVQISLSIGFAILIESGLSFLGLGTPLPEPSWGNMIGMGRGYMTHTGWYVFWPALIISITILCCNTLGDGLRDTLDPRLRR
jgi:peptide/nickel transport system permease protein